MTRSRKLAAVLAADVVGFSRLTGTDEDRTLARLRALRSDLLDPTIAVHQGRVVKWVGDGTIVEFRSVVEAVRCGIEIQDSMVERNAGLPPERRIEYRIGIHLGDVVEENDGDLMGDGVNIAACLEGVARPRAICLSEDAYRQVKSRLDLVISDLGETQLKNIAEPMHIYSLQCGGADAARLNGTAASAAPGLSLPDKPSIAVLAFQNMSGDPEQEYFADGIVEDIVTALSRFHQLLVIARNSSFVYKGLAVDVKQVSRELGVRYVLEGSVRNAANHIRITAQLIDAATRVHLWADRFDGGLEDVFELQDQVTARVVGEIAPKLEQAEIERTKLKPTDSLDAYDYYLRGRANLNRGSRDATGEAMGQFYQALRIDPPRGHRPREGAGRNQRPPAPPAAPGNQIWRRRALARAPQSPCADLYRAGRNRRIRRHLCGADRAPRRRGGDRNTRHRPLVEEHGQGNGRAALRRPLPHRLP
jgi:TolB-like protein/class 3 adenylate cyclase